MKFESLEEINKIIHYCDVNIIELIEKEKILKPYESLNKIRFNQLVLVREFLHKWKKMRIENYEGDKNDK